MKKKKKPHSKQLWRVNICAHAISCVTAKRTIETMRFSFKRHLASFVQREADFSLTGRGSPSGCWSSVWELGPPSTDGLELQKNRRPRVHEKWRWMEGKSFNESEDSQKSSWDSSRFVPSTSRMFTPCYTLHVVPRRTENDISTAHPRVTLHLYTSDHPLSLCSPPLALYFCQGFCPLQARNSAYRWWNQSTLQLYT